MSAGMAIGDSMTIAMVAALTIGWTSVPLRRTAAIGAAGIVAIAIPALIVPGVLIGALLNAIARVRSARAAAMQNEADLAALCDLTVIGLTGGLGVQTAIEIAADHVGDEMARNVNVVLRRARVDGMAAAMAANTGSGRRFYQVVGGAAETGAPLLGPVTQLSDELHADLASSRLQAVRRLPVALLFPLTLLILPGFLLLTVAPAILEAFARLEI